MHEGWNMVVAFLSSGGDGHHLFRDIYLILDGFLPMSAQFECSIEVDAFPDLICEARPNASITWWRASKRCKSSA